MKKNVISLLLIGIFLISSAVATADRASAANDSLTPGIYVDGKLHTTIAEFKKLKTADKTKLLMNESAYLCLGKELIKTQNILSMNNQQLESSKITVGEYEAIVGGVKPAVFEVIGIE